MVDGQLFDTLAALAMELRQKPHVPFGGIQVSNRPQDTSLCSHPGAYILC